MMERASVCTIHCRLSVFCSACAIFRLFIMQITCRWQDNITTTAAATATKDFADCPIYRYLYLLEWNVYMYLACYRGVYAVVIVCGFYLGLAMCTSMKKNMTFLCWWKSSMRHNDKKFIDGLQQDWFDFTFVYVFYVQIDILTKTVLLIYVKV